MRAIVIVSGTPEDITLAEAYTTPLLPLVDRPFLQHVVEYLVEGGVTTFDFVVSHLPEKVERLLGDGTRWGSQFRFHLAPDETKLYSTMRRVGGKGDETLLLIHADRLPQVRQEYLRSLAGDSPVLFRNADGDWTGWAALRSTLFANAPLLADETAVETWLGTFEGTSHVSVEKHLEVRSFAGLLHAQNAVAREEFPSLLQTGRTVVGAPSEIQGQTGGIRLGRGVTVHPTARLIAPVFIGENSRIGEGATIGPNVVISENVMVGEKTTIRDALLLPGTYVGDGLELTEIIAERARVWSVRHGDAVSVPDAFLMGDLHENQVADWTAETQSRLIAFVLLLCFWPVLVATAVCLLFFRRGPLFHRHSFVILPATLDARDWRTATFGSFHADPLRLHGITHLILHVLPGLPAACVGTVRLVGVVPRTPEAVADLPQDFKGNYVRSKPGLIVDLPMSRGHVSEEQLRTAEAFYVATASARTDLTVLMNYFQGDWLPRLKSGAL